MKPSADSPEELPPRDTLRRALREVRISVTDRCNFRCIYCMPRAHFGKNHRFLSHADVLRFEEIARLARILRSMGVGKIRITGGEPLLRRDVDQLIAQLAQIDGLDLALTTNGVLLPRLAARLRAAGLRRVTVSLDALDEAIFQRMSDTTMSVRDVLAGIDAAAAAGLHVKVNTVVRRGCNDGEIVPLARYFRGTGHILRFIEFMDAGTTNGWNRAQVMSAQEMLAQVQAVFALHALPPNHAGETARRYAYQDGAGEIGVIASVTQPFCQTCTRLRITTDGRLYTCLFAEDGADIRAPLRAGQTDAALRERIANVWRARADRYSMLRSAQAPLAQNALRAGMSYLGG